MIALSSQLSTVLFSIGSLQSLHLLIDLHPTILMPPQQPKLQFLSICPTITNLDFSTPVWFIDYYENVGAISLIVNSYVLFLVVFKSDRLDNFKYYLLAFQSSCLLVDVHLTLLMQPHPLHPIPAGFCTGLLGQDNLVSVINLMTILAGVASAQFCTLPLCFFQKFLSIRRIERSELALWKRVLVTAMLPTLPLTVMMYFLLASNSREEEFEIIHNVYPEYEEEFRNLVNFSLLELNMYYFFMLATVVVGAVWFGGLIFYCTKRSYEILDKLKSSMSEVAHRKHENAIRSLLAQFVCTFFALCPPAVICLMLIVEYQYAQVLCRYMIMMFCTHATLNATVLLLTTPSYRNFTFYCIKPT